MDKDSRIYIAGHNGMVGKSLEERLKEEGYINIFSKSSAELDLRNKGAVDDFFQKSKPEYVFLLAAKVGGIQANINYPYEFIYDNLAIELNVLNAAYKSNVKRLIFTGSSCIYPKDIPQPMKEDDIFKGQPEVTNEFFAYAKIAGIKLCQALNKEYKKEFISVIPSNAYGPGDNFDLENSHVMSAVIDKLFTAKKEQKNSVVFWGTGKPEREFIYVEDLASALIFIMLSDNPPEVINIGSGETIAIKKLVELVNQFVKFSGEIIFDSTKPDGKMRKQVDNSLIYKLGWKPKFTLHDGILKTINWYKSI